MRFTYIRLATSVCVFLAISANAWSQDAESLMMRRRMIYECYIGNFEAVVDLAPRLETLDYREGPFPPGKWLDIENGDLWTPLTAAIDGRHWAIASYLVGRGASADFATGDHCSPIWFVADRANGEPQAIALATLLLKSGADVREHPTVPDPFGDTPLRRAVVHSEVEITRLLLKYGADLGDGDCSTRNWGLKFFARMFESRTTLPMTYSPSDWKRSKEMYDLLLSAGTRQEKK